MFGSIAAFLGGLGIFFAGMYLLSENLTRLTGRRFREAVAVWTKSVWASLFWGLTTGAVMQSTSAITFIVVSMLGSGLLTVAAALAIIIGCNIGTCLLVVIAALDVQTFVLLTLGVSGVAFASERLAPIRTLLLAIFGIGLVFLGLDMVTRAAAPFATDPRLQEFIAGTGDSYMLLFAIGLILSFVTQATNSIALLAITLCIAGVISFEQAVMAIYGANVGSSFVTLALSVGLRGRQRQVSMYQFWFNPIAAAVVLPLFYLEVYAGIPLLNAFYRLLSADVGLQLAYSHVFFNVVGAVLLTPLIGPSVRLLARLYPPPPEENEAAPQFIYDQAARDPETALDLVIREQQRLVSYLPMMLDIARESPKDAAQRIARRKDTSAKLATAIEDFLERLGEAQISHSAYERLGQALVLQRNIEGLGDTMADLTTAIVGAGENAATRRLTGNLVEGLDAALLTLVDATGPDGADDRALLAQMSGDRGTLMRRLREEYLASDATLAPADKMTILSVTNLAERASWLIQRLVAALPAEARPVPLAAAARAAA